ncbi:hypothetical protein BUALT_Bualt07G0157800 [Buddleja alternifolia]|uniref:Uncharacterized protein n=1 Tax=Buddleja alternifolia TaxID=168488 RepID=A0AAV6XLS7_9LAMI|nr:hypothetical protein BUALT_Bualt07G0157800 [Buddleja alternifolia]
MLQLQPWPPPLHRPPPHFRRHTIASSAVNAPWGPQVGQAKQKCSQRLYISEQTDSSSPNTLIIATIEVVKPRVAKDEHIAKFDEETRSPFLKKSKTIIHPGEDQLTFQVNRIRELPQNSNILATHTDSPHVFVWDVQTQRNRQSVVGSNPSDPDLTLTGHKDNAEYALAMCPMEPFVLSGGKDRYVVLWSIHDHISSLAANQEPSKNSTVGARGIFKGHKNTVEDVQFNPASPQEFCSVGDDCCLILWDSRSGHVPAVKVKKAHNADIHCVDWNPNNVNLILTGSADNTICVYDRRKLTSKKVGSPVHILEGHTAPVLCAQWSPAKASVFGSSAEDSMLNIWDLEKIGKTQGSSRKGKSIHPPGLFFRHAGHRGKVVDFHWNAEDPWTIASVSEDVSKLGGGGTLQIWRITDLINRPVEVVVSELENLKNHVPECSSSIRSPGNS